jgi:superfamily II DNA or RNA helicase
MAAQEHLSRGGKVVVLVPGKTLAGQWREELERVVHQSRIGQLGDGSNDSLRKHDVLVATVQSGFRREILTENANALLIADECHNYGSPKFREALEPGFRSRMGLTATYERSDDGIETALNPFFGGVCYRIGYERALRDEIVAPFRIALIGVVFSGDEQSEYDLLGSRLKKHSDVLIRSHGFPDVWHSPEMWGLFLQSAERLSRSQQFGSEVARKFLTAFAKRRKLLAEAGAKATAVERLAPAVKRSKRALVFTQTQAAARAAAASLVAQGIPATSVCGGYEDGLRDAILEEFRNGKHHALAAPRVLDEGVDVPEADLAIVLAASRSKRQMIQRMGRILRLKDDGRVARFAIVFVTGTSEDPRRGAHESFLQEALDNADDYQYFDGPNAASGAVPYLLRFAPTARVAAEAPVQFPGAANLAGTPGSGARGNRRIVVPLPISEGQRPSRWPAR